MAAEKTVSVKGLSMAERGRETESHDLPERAVKSNLRVLEKPPSVENNYTRNVIFGLCEYTHVWQPRKYGLGQMQSATRSNLLRTN